MPKPGDLVIYYIGERIFPALVIHAHTTVQSHLGEDDEPLLHLVYVDPDVKLAVGQAGYKDFVRTEFDVVHQSHTFDADYIQKHGSDAGPGRWCEEHEEPTPQRLAREARQKANEPTPEGGSEQPSDLPPGNAALFHPDAGIAGAGSGRQLQMPNPVPQAPGSTQANSPLGTTSPDLTDMSKAERKEELGGMKKAELRDAAEQHGVATDDSMTKREITSAINKQLNQEAKTGTDASA